MYSTGLVKVIQRGDDPIEQRDFCAARFFGTERATLTS